MADGGQGFFKLCLTILTEEDKEEECDSYQSTIKDLDTQLVEVCPKNEI